MPVVSNTERIRRPVVARPARKAAVPALLYVALCMLYIIYSDQLVIGLSKTPQQIQMLSTAKGIVFVAITGLLFFLVSYARWKHIHDQENIIIAHEKSLLQTERRHVAAMCVATVMHDLNNLLMTLSGLSDELRNRETDVTALRAMRESMENGIDKLSSLSKRMAATASRVLPDNEEDVNIQTALPSLLALVRKHPDVRACTIVITDAPTPTLLLNRQIFEATVINLILNAAQAAGPKGRIEVHVVPAADAVVLHVHDNGPGVPEENLKRIFDPCFTTKPNGTGLGLVAVKMFAAASGATITVDRSPLGGALFSLWIPFVRKTSRPVTSDEVPEQAPLLKH